MSEAADNPAFTLLQASVADALECLAGKRLADKRVHSARKAVKRARAGLRLLRPTMTEADYQKENIALRNAGRCLSPLRDAKSLVDTFNTFTSRYAEQLRGLVLAPLKRSLLAKRALARRELVDTPAKLGLCVDLLEACLERTRQSSLAHADSATTIEGLRRIYRKCRKTFALAQEARTSEALHDWRKQVKYLLNAGHALRGSGVGHLHKLNERADRIADWLGDDQDLVLLHDAVRDSPIDDKAAAIVLGLIALRRAKLQDRALQGDGGLFAESPKRFVARLDTAVTSL